MKIAEMRVVFVELNGWNDTDLRLYNMMKGIALAKGDDTTSTNHVLLVEGNTVIEEYDNLSEKELLTELGLCDSPGELDDKWFVFDLIS